MHKVRMALVIAASISFASTSAMASLPKLSSPERAVIEISGSQSAAPVQTASFANGCNDPDYAWYEYSGIEALTCLLSGQWT